MNVKILHLSRLGLLAGSLLVAAGVMVGCKPKASPPPVVSSGGDGYFHTSFQSECQFIVQAIVSDLAAQMVYAAKHELPSKQAGTVIATDRQIDALVYELYGLTEDEIKLVEGNI